MDLIQLKHEPAMEAVMFGNLPLNKYLRSQDKLRLPNKDGNEVILVTPNAESSMSVMNGGFLTLIKDNYKAYVTETRIIRRVGTQQVREIGYTEWRKFYKDNIFNKSIIFYSEGTASSIIGEGRRFIFDTGRYHSIYFSKRKSSKPVDYLCNDYMRFLIERIDCLAEHYTKTLLIPIEAWAAAGATIGIGNKMMNNPISIFLKCMLKYPSWIEELRSRDVTIVFFNSQYGEVIKFQFPRDKTNPAIPKELTASDIKALYQKLKPLILRMHIPVGKIDLEEEEDPVEPVKKEEAKKPPTGMPKPETKQVIMSKEETEKACPVAETVKEKLVAEATGKPARPKPAKIEVEEDDTFDASDLMSENYQDEDSDEIEDEISDTIANAVKDVPELTDDSVSDARKAAILEDEVKTKVFASKFVPERSKKQMEYIDAGAARQSRVVNQSVDRLKSKIIDERTVDKRVVDTISDNIRTIKFANADKDYVEKKYMADINDCVTILNKGDIKIFVEDIEEVDSSDQMNQKKTLTYHLIDENGKKHTLTFDIPIIRDGVHVFLGGHHKMIMHQRILMPIVKIAPDVAQIVTFYNKVQINRHGKVTTSDITAIKRYLTKHEKKHHVKFGNSGANNGKYKTTLEFDDIARSMTQCSVIKQGVVYTIYFDLSKAEALWMQENPNEKGNPFTSDKPPCIRMESSGKAVWYGTDDITFELKQLIPEIQDETDNAPKKGGKFMYARAEILNEHIPVALFCTFCDGFTVVMSKCGIRHEFVQEKKMSAELKQDFSRKYHNWSYIEIADGMIVYDESLPEVRLFMNGLKGIGLEMYTRAELDDKDTYIDLMSNYYASANQAYNLDKFRMFLIDNKTKEILEDYGLPTDLIEIFFYVCKLLSTNQYLNTGDMHNMRIRSNEIISQIAYQYIVEAYSEFYKTSNNKKPERISVPKDCVIKALLSASLCDEDSVVNPVYQLEKTRATTITGSTSAKNITLTGLNKIDGYTMDNRAFSKTMTGIFGLTSPADANVGIIRDLCLEPSVTSTNGYVDVVDMEDVGELNTKNLFTAVELLTPPGVLHDDPQRSAMMRGQTSKMLMVEGAQPVLIGNKVESIIPYHLNNDYCFKAKDAGEVIDEKDGVYVVKYKNGEYDSFSTNEIVRKNASNGSYVKIQFETKLKVGSKFIKDEILAVEPKAFTKNKFDRGASCNIGVLAKIAIASVYDVFEDSEPCTYSLARRLGYDAIEMEDVSLDAGTYVEKMVKVGDKVSIHDPLIIFDTSRGDADIQAYLDNMRKSMKDQGILEEVIASNNTTIKAPTSGEITDIKIYTTVPVEDLSPTLQKIVKAYHAKIKGTEKFLEKYKNPGDNAYYKCGHLFDETTDTIDTKFGKVKGKFVGEGVLIEFYIKHRDIVKKGDKCTNFIAAKGVNSHLIPEGLEPWSESRPDEEISAFITPISISARKIPSIYFPMFGNKLLIERKRQMVAKYKKMRGLK